MALLVIIAVVIFEFWTVVLMLMLFGLRIAGLVAFLPFLPLFFALRGVPVVTISNSADGIIHLWVYLVLLPLPVAAMLAIGFSGGMADMIMSLDIGGAILLAMLQIGSLLGAIIVPFAMYQKMKEHGLATGFSNGGKAPGHKLRDSYERQRDTAARRRQQYQQNSRPIRNFKRGMKDQHQYNVDSTDGVWTDSGSFVEKGDTRAWNTGESFRDSMNDYRKGR